MKGKRCRASVRGDRKLSSRTQVFAELMESFSLSGFRYSPLGLRDGILAQMLAAQDDRAAAHRQFEMSAGSRDRDGATLWRGYAAKQNRCVHMSCSCFAISGRFTGFPPEYEDWLSAAASVTRHWKVHQPSGASSAHAILVSMSEIYGYRRYSAPLFRPSRVTWAKVGRSRTIAPCAIFHRMSTSMWSAR